MFILNPEADLDPLLLVAGFRGAEVAHIPGVVPEDAAPDLTPESVAKMANGSSIFFMLYNFSLGITKPPH